MNANLELLWNVSNTNGASRSGQEKQKQMGSPGGMQLSPTVQAMGINVIQGVTTAFLDAYVKNDPIAREWLEKDASQWIRDRGEIKQK